MERLVERAAVRIAGTTGHAHAGRHAAGTAGHTRRARRTGRLDVDELDLEGEHRATRDGRRVAALAVRDLRRAGELRRLREHHGLDETKVSVSNKLSRGTFSASFFFAAMKIYFTSE